MQGDDRKARRKLERLRTALAAGERDLSAGRFVILETDEEIGRFFDKLLDQEPSSAPDCRGRR
jgi:hypothetical protein